MLQNQETIQKQVIHKALIIRQEWLNKIFNTGKYWEMRFSNTKQRGKIGLIESGSGLIVGECEIINSFKITKEQAEKNFNAHQVGDLSLLDKWCYAWELSNVIKYEKPIPYCHPRGAVIWVKLN